MEASVINFCKKKALVINAGKFGDRFSKIVKAHNKELVEFKYEWDTPASVDDIVEAITNDDEIDTICIQICESAGGLRHPVEEIASKVKAINPDITIIADGITAVLVEPFNAENVDVVIAGSQKAFMLPPGLSMIGLNKSAIKKLEENGGAGFYFNLLTELKKQRTNTTAWTAPTTLIIGLNAILKKVFKEYGVFATYLDTRQKAVATREAMKSIGLEIYPKSPANAMTTVYTEYSNEIRKILKEEYQVNIAGGQDHLKGKIFRINHMGHIPDNEACWVVNAIELALDKLNIREFDGTANKIFINKLRAK
jgi:aspartate aminotransferase-like enzyme